MDVKSAELVSLIPALRAFARTFRADATEADDLVQETLTKAIANIDQFQPGTRMKSWLFTIMRNTFYTRIRKLQREAPGLMECASSRLTSEASQEWSLRGKEVQQAINRLPARQAEVLMLIAVLGMSYEDTAEVCNVAIGTVKSRLNRARAGLLEDMGETSAKGAIERSSKFSVSQAYESAHL